MKPKLTHTPNQARTGPRTNPPQPSTLSRPDPSEVRGEVEEGGFRDMDGNATGYEPSAVPSPAVFWADQDRGVVPMCRTQCRCDQMGHCLLAAPDWTPTPRRADTDVDDDDGASHAHVAGVLHMPRTVPVFAEAEGTSSNPPRPRVCGLAHLQPSILHPV